MKRVLIIPKLLLGICIVIGIGLFWEGIDTKMEIHGRTIGYTSTEGYYTDMELYSEAERVAGHYKTATYRLIYTYCVDGVSYIAKTDHGTGAIPQIGSVKEIWYDPANPSKALVGGTNSSDVLIFTGLFFTLIPLVLVVGMMVLNGRFDNLSFNMMDIVVGIVMLVIGLGMIYIIAGGFSLIELFMLAGPFALIPLMFLPVGIIMIKRGITTKSKSERKKRKRKERT